MPEQLALPDPKLDPRNQKTYSYQMTFVRATITQAARIVFPLITHISVEGAQHLPANGPVILAANHMTNFDVFPIQFNLSRPIFFMAKAELFRNPLIDFVYRKVGAFPVYRGERDAWALRHAREVLERGLVLGMFPEGKRSKEGGLNPAKTGAARLALSTNSPILPVAIHGTREILKHFPQRAEVRLRIGNLIYPLPGETALGLTDRIMFSLGAMLPPDARGVYAFRPEGF